MKLFNCNVNHYYPICVILKIGVLYYRCIRNKISFAIRRLHGRIRFRIKARVRIRVKTRVTARS